MTAMLTPQMGDAGNRNTFDLSGRVAIVTGAGRGLGAAISQALSNAGCQLVLAARTASEIAEVAAEIAAGGGKAIAQTCDVRDPDSCAALVEKAVETFGRLDIAAINHGVGRGARPELTTANDWKESIDINLTGAFYVAQAVGREMIRAGKGGSIVFTTSTGSIRAFDGLSAYGASKGGVDQLCRQLAVEWGQHGIRVNAMGPGYTTHPMRAADRKPPSPEFEAALRLHTPLGRRGEPREMAEPVVFLASDAASFVSGQILMVDGGYCCI